MGPTERTVERAPRTVLPWPGGTPAAASAPGPPVLLLHGFASSPRVMAPLAVHLRRRLGRPALRWSISPGSEDLRCTAAALQRRIEGLDPDGRNAPLDVVAHSMGGLAAAYWLKRFDGGRRIARVVTLGTPHRGTRLARPAAWIWGTRRPALRQMCPDSPLVRELATLPPPGPARLVSVAGGRDLLVRPRSARIADGPSAQNLCLADATHWSLLFSGAALELVARLLEAPADEARAEPPALAA